MLIGSGSWVVNLDGFALYLKKSTLKRLKKSILFLDLIGKPLYQQLNAHKSHWIQPLTCKARRLWGEPG